MSTEAAQCERHGRPTHVRCPDCDKPICPRCYVRTAVSPKCPACAGVPVSPARERARRYAVPVAAILVVGGLAAFLSSAAIQGGRDDNGSPPTTVTPPGIGHEARERELAFVVTRLDCRGKELAVPGLEDEEPVVAQGRFCLLHVKVRNTASQPVLYSSELQRLVDDRGREYEASPVATVLAQEVEDQKSSPITSLFVERLNPGVELTRVLAFDVPADANPTAAELHTRPNTIGVRVKLSSGGAG